MTRETFQAPVAGGVLAGYIDGVGPPVLVLHGGPGLSVSIVDGLVADLVPAYRVATFQQRGIEPSVLDGEFTVDEAVADVGAVLDHLGWDTAYVVGSSWGGHLGFWVAGALPGRLRGMLAVDPLGAVGDGSPIPNSAGRASAERVPAAWTEVVPGAGHLPWFEAPEAVRQALDRLAAHSSASSA